MLDEYDELKAFAMYRFAIEEALCANGAQASDCYRCTDDYGCNYEYDYNGFEGYIW